MSDLAVALMFVGAVLAGPLFLLFLFWRDAR